jgi:hypothetical protein
MTFHKLFAVTLVALASMLAAPPASSQVAVGVGIRIGPPPLRYERVVARPFAHAIWIRGHWEWSPRFDRYVWVRGNWVAGRQGFTWVDGRWNHEAHGWVWREGYWSREFREHPYRHDREGRDRDHRNRR